MSKLDTEEAFGRGIVGNEIGVEASARKSESWVLLVAIHQQSPGSSQCAYFLPWGGYKELAVCSSSLSGNFK